MCLLCVCVYVMCMCACCVFCLYLCLCVYLCKRMCCVCLPECMAYVFVCVRVCVCMQMHMHSCMSMLDETVFPKKFCCHLSNPDFLRIQSQFGGVEPHCKLLHFYFQPVLWDSSAGEYSISAAQLQSGIHCNCGYLHTFGCIDFHHGWRRASKKSQSSQRHCIWQVNVVVVRGGIFYFFPTYLLKVQILLVFIVVFVQCFFF